MTDRPTDQPNDRPTNQKMDRRAHKEVSLQINFYIFYLMNKVLVLDLALKEGESSALLQGFRLNQYLFAQFGSLREKKLKKEKKSIKIKLVDLIARIKLSLCTI